jgi:hypothetical protein
MGLDTTANGHYSTAIGRKITVNGDNSVGIGLDGNSYTVSNDNVMSIIGGNVGIGTTNPQSKLEVDGMIHSTSGGFKFPDGTIQTTSTDGHSLDAADGDPTDVVYVDDEGNVGINKTTASEKLDVSGHINATPIVGRWEQTLPGGPNTNYVWDEQLINTNPDYLGWTTGSEYITIKKAGYYQINVNVMQVVVDTEYNRGDVALKRNNENIVVSISFAPVNEYFANHHITTVEYFNANDTVSVYSTCHIYGHTIYPYSTLSIIKLN